MKAEGSSFHPGVTGEGKTGRVKRVNLRDVPLSVQLRPVGRFQRGIGLAVEKWQVPIGERAPGREDTTVPG